MPSTDPITIEGCREEKLRHLLITLSWKHLSCKHHVKIQEIMLKYPDLFILGPSEIGTIQLPPAKFHISDPNPIRAPRY